MPSAKPDKPLFAATDLLTELPEGVRFREAEVWAGLEGSLRRRRRRGVVLRLSIAAALLLALAMGWWLRPQGVPARDVAAHTPGKRTVAPAVAKATDANTARTAPVEIQVPATASVSQKPERSETPDTPTPLALRKQQQPGPDTATVAPQPEATLTASLDPVTPAPASSAPARRFRIAHINDNAPQQPALADLPADERPNSGIFHFAGAAGPNAESPADPGTERRPRTLMSLFKPHQ